MLIEANERKALQQAAGSRGEASASAASAKQGRSDALGKCEVLSFNLGQERYGIEILKVQEIRGYTEPTHIANAPSHIKGVTNLRGIIVPIVDLRLMFGMPDGFDSSTVTIVLNVSGRVVGIVVDSVSDVRSLAPDVIKSVPDFSSRAESDYITGVASLSDAENDHLLIVLDIERLIRGADIGLDVDYMN